MTKAQLKAWLATARFANLPTVWSTVIVVSALVDTIIYETPGTLNWLKVAALPCLYYSFIYSGGCLLGDALDEDFDRKNRPQRPIPKGTLKSNHVFIVAALLLLGGLAALLCHSWVMGSASFVASHVAQVMLVSCVVSYARFHKSLPKLGLPLMAACRGLLVLAATLLFLGGTPGASSFGWQFLVVEPLFIAYAVSMTMHTVVVVLVARTESDERAVNKVGILIATVILSPLILFCVAVLRFSSRSPVDVLKADIPLALLVGLFLARIVTRASSHLRPQNLNKAAFVGTALSAFPFIDMTFLSRIALASPPLILVPLLCYVSARGLQKYTPAT